MPFRIFFDNLFLWKIVGYSEFLLFSLLIISIIIYFSDIKKIIINLFNKNDFLIIIILFFLGFFIRIMFFDNSHVNIYDELSYIKHARGLLYEGEILTYTRSIGWEFLLSIVFLFFGISSFTGFMFSIFLGTVSIIVFYMIIKLIFNDRYIAFFSSLLFCILPFHIFWSIRLETNIISMLMILICILYYLKYEISKNISFFYLSIILTFFASTFRGENIIILSIPLFILSLLNFKEIYLNIKVLFKSILIFIISFCLSLPDLLIQYNFTNMQNWSNGEIDNISITNIGENFLFFIDGFFNNELFFYFNIFTFIGLIYFIFLLFKKSFDFRKIIIYFIPLFLLIIVYNLVWLKYVGGVSRLYMEVYPIYIIFFAFGIYFVLNFISEKSKINIAILFIVLVFLNFINPKLYLKATDNEKLQTILSNKFKNEIYNDSCSYILPSYIYYKAFVDFEVLFVHSLIETDKESIKEFLNTKQCIYFIEDESCFISPRGWKVPSYVEPMNISYCDLIRKNFILEKEKSYKLGYVEYNIYRVK